MFPGRGSALSNAWRTLQIEYTWLRTLTGHYVDFWKVTEDSLVFAAGISNIDLTAGQRARLMRAYLEMAAWSEPLPAFRALRSAGVRLALLANFTAGMLDAAVANSGLRGLFEPPLSTDQVQASKPDPRTYEMALRALAMKRENILFAAFGGWDAAGAKTCGIPTFWVNRLSLPAEELDVVPDGIGSSLADLASFVPGPP